MGKSNRVPNNQIIENQLCRRKEGKWFSLYLVKYRTPSLNKGNRLSGRKLFDGEVVGFGDAELFHF